MLKTLNIYNLSGPLALQISTVEVQVLPASFSPLYFTALMTQFWLDVNTSFAVFTILDCQKESETTGENGTRIKPVLLTVKIFTVWRLKLTELQSLGKAWRSHRIWQIFCSFFAAIDYCYIEQLSHHKHFQTPNLYLILCNIKKLFLVMLRGVSSLA